MFELESYVPKARDILRRVPLIGLRDYCWFFLRSYAEQPIDGHNDWPHLIRGFYDNIIEDVSFDCGKSLVGQVDMQRLRKGLVGGVFLSAYVDWYSYSCRGKSGSLTIFSPTEDDFSVDAHLPAHLETMQQIDLIYRLIDKYSDHLVVAPRASDIQPIFHSGKIAVMIGVEGLHQIANSPGVLRMYYRLGVRYISLTHNANNLYADSAVCFIYLPSSIH
jgi:membrane dipeptidase